MVSILEQRDAKFMCFGKPGVLCSIPNSDSSKLQGKIAQWTLQNLQEEGPVTQ